LISPQNYSDSDDGGQCSIQILSTRIVKTTSSIFLNKCLLTLDLFTLKNASCCVWRLSHPHHFPIYCHSLERPLLHTGGRLNCLQGVGSICSNLQKADSWNGSLLILVPDVVEWVWFSESAGQG